MDIWKIVRDIFNDIDTNTMRQNDFSGYLQESQHTTGRRTEGFGILPLYLPQLIGAALGLAFARLLGGGAAAYAVLGLICALAFGTWKNYEFDKIDIKHALIRNVILVLPLIAFILIIVYASSD